MPKQIETDERAQFLEECFAKGLAFAEGLTTVWMLFGNECCKLLIDKEALAALAEPVGWSGSNWGKAAYRFPDWFDGTRKEITATQLMTLAYFAGISEEKSKKLYAQWVDEGVNWDLATVREKCEELAERKKRINGIKVTAEVSFDKKGKQIIASPNEETKFAWDRSDGKYTVTLKKVKE